MVVKDQYSARHHARIDELTTVPYRLIDIDVDMRKSKSLIFHSDEAVWNQTFPIDYPFLSSDKVGNHVNTRIRKIAFLMNIARLIAFWHSSEGIE
jgi:hypothetical protein